MHIDYTFLTGSKCPPEEAEALFPTLGELLSLADTARKTGLASLEPVISASAGSLLGDGLAMVLDGYDPAMVEDILRSWMYLSGRSDRDRLHDIIVAQGVLCIQRALPRERVIALLLSWLDEPMRERALEYLREELRAAKLGDGAMLEYFASGEPKTPLEADSFAELLLNTFVIQRIVYRADPETVALAICLYDKKTQKRLLSPLPSVWARRIAGCLMSAVDYGSPGLADASEAARGRISGILKALEEAGEILLI